MDDHTISLVRESFDLIEPVAPQAGLAFCQHLVASEPALQRLFQGDLAGAAVPLIKGLAEVIAHLDQPNNLQALLTRLGRRLGSPEPSERELEVAWQAALLTLYQHLGVAYNEEVEKAWMDMLRELSASLSAGRGVPREVASA